MIFPTHGHGRTPGMFARLDSAPHVELRIARFKGSPASVSEEYEWGIAHPVEGGGHCWLPPDHSGECQPK